MPEKVEGLYTLHYIKHIYNHMKKEKRRWYTDAAGTLWHIDDAEAMLNNHLRKRE